MSSTKTLRRPAGPKEIYRHTSRVGSFYIAPSRKGWDVQHAGETLGSRYPSAQGALNALAGGRTRLTRDGTDPSTLGLAAAIEDWDRLGWVSLRQ